MNSWNFQLEPHQGEILKGLMSMNKALGLMYLGALRVLHDGRNPDRLALAAHSMRELMEKLPRHPNTEVKSGNISLKEKVRQLEENWNECCKNSKCYDSKNSHWSGVIDKHLEKLLRALYEFFIWVKKHRPRRKEEIADVLRKLDPLKIPLPDPIESLRIREWIEIKEFFINVSHHRQDTELSEFKKWLYALERILLDFLYPRVTEDAREIDKIIEEVEAND